MIILFSFDISIITRFFSNNFGIENFWDVILVVLDIGVVSYLFYRLVLLIRETRAWQLIKGILVILIATKVSEFFGLQTVSYLLQHTIQYIAIALVVLFQPELRSALEQIGRRKFSSYLGLEEGNPYISSSSMVKELVGAVSELAKTKTGALIIIEKDTKIGEIIKTGIQLDSNVKSALLINIFSPNTPLHDGAVVIRNNKIQAASCFLPLTDNTSISLELGTRHRAAIGVSEISDSISIIVSEETGTISIAQYGKIIRNLNAETLRKTLQEELTVNTSIATNKKLNLWKVKTK